MTNTFVRNPLPLATLFGLTLPALGHANCIPTVPAKYAVPFAMVSLKNFSSAGTPYASYATGLLYYTSVPTGNWQGRMFGNINQHQLFSDRTFAIACEPSCGSTIQPFNVNAYDDLGISVFDGYQINMIGHPELIKVTFTLESYGNGNITLTGKCDATSGELYLTSSEAMYLMTFGTPYQANP